MQENFKLLSFQIIITLIFVYVIGHSVYFIEMLADDGEPSLVFLTLLLSIGFDQIKSVIFLFLIYVVIVRRFGHLAVNEHEYVSAEILALPTQEDALPRLQQYCLKLLNSNTFEMISMILISVYTVYVLFQLTIADIFNIPESLLA